MQTLINAYKCTQINRKRQQCVGLTVLRGKIVQSHFISVSIFLDLCFSKLYYRSAFVAKTLLFSLSSDLIAHKLYNAWVHSLISSLHKMFYPSQCYFLSWVLSCPKGGLLRWCFEFICTMQASLLYLTYFVLTFPSNSLIILVHLIGQVTSKKERYTTTYCCFLTSSRTAVSSEYLSGQFVLII